MSIGLQERPTEPPLHAYAQTPCMKHARCRCSVHSVAAHERIRRGTKYVRPNHHLFYHLRRCKNHNVIRCCCKIPHGFSDRCVYVPRYSLSHYRRARISVKLRLFWKSTFDYVPHFLNSSRICVHLCQSYRF